MGKQPSTSKVEASPNGPRKPIDKRGKSKFQRIKELYLTPNKFVKPNKSEKSKPAKPKPKPAKHEQIEWNPHDTKYITINMNEYSPIKLPKICNLIFDTLIFSRLKRDKQLGSCSYVFPSATHTRFEHSVGTAFLAHKFVKHLNKILPEKYKLTGNEQLDVILAALLRNVGHSAFSYLYEECFATPGLHIEMSVKLIDKMLADSLKTFEGLRQHLTDKDFKIIKFLINPKPVYNNKGQWIPPFPLEKSYILDIVNNVRNGLDVDKLDYIYRDGLRSGLNKYSINMNIIERLKNFSVVGHINEVLCLKYPESSANEIRSIFESKSELFKTLYYYKNVLAKDEMIKEAFKLAGPHLMFRTRGGLEIPFERCHEDLDAYIQLTDDSLYEKILHPLTDHPDLIKAQNILKAVENRKIPKLVADIECVGKNDPSLNAENIKGYLKSRKNFKSLSFEVNQVNVISKCINVGKNFDTNPMDHVFFYPRNDKSKTVWVDRKLESVKCAYIFVPYGSSITDAEKIFKAVKEYCSLHELPSPVAHFRKRYEDSNVI